MRSSQFLISAEELTEEFASAKGETIQQDISAMMATSRKRLMKIPFIPIAENVKLNKKSSAYPEI